MKKSYNIRKCWILIIFFGFVTGLLFMRSIYDFVKDGALWGNVYASFFRHGIERYSPYMLYMDGVWEDGDLTKRLFCQFYEDMPLEMCALNTQWDKLYVTEYLQDSDFQGRMMASDDDGGQFETETENLTGEDCMDTVAACGMQSLEQAVLAENSAATGTFIPVQAPVAMYSREQLREPGFIKETFYAEDATTQVREDQLAYDQLMGYDASLKQDNSNIQILVYHTHSQETYIDSVPGDANTSIVGVGEHLCGILRTQYGFNVLHHMGEYDIEGRDFAYSNAMKGLEQVLAENPTIEVMIDLHRDETNADTKLVATVQNKTMAKFMFFNGLCYTRELGNLENLPNPYIQDNLSFAFQLQLAAEEYYPGITRRIYLKGYRYNLHYRPKSLLIELGAQTNTVDEAMNSCEPLAHIIAMGLNGENKK